MSFMEHLDAMRKDMQSMAQQMQQNKAEIEKTKHDLTQIQLQMQQTNDQGAQLELAKSQEMAKRLENIAKTYVAAIPDNNIQGQMMNELDTIVKGVASPAAAAAAVGGIPMVQPMAAMAAAAMHPNMMMRNPLLNAMGGGSPRVGKGGGPNGGMPNGMNMQAMMAQQMQLAQMHAMAQMMHGVPMMGMPGMGMPGMPPGMAAIPGMFPPGAAAAMQQHMAQQMAQSIAVSTPSRNPSNSGVASRTRTPLTASATNSPRPSEPAIVQVKEEEPTPTDPEVSQVSVVNEDNTTVAVA